MTREERERERERERSGCFNSSCMGAGAQIEVVRLAVTAKVRTRSGLKEERPALPLSST